jgi:MFS transporter, DHA3 family, macrolide efflux protein
MTTQQIKKNGMRVFTLVWFGQMVSIIGSGLTGFALDIWVYQHTKSVTQFAIASLCTLIPGLLLSPIAGTLVDGWNRRWCMIIADTCTAFSILPIALLLFSDRLEVWHVYLATAIASIFGTFQSPAYHASIAMLVPKDNLNRANGMIQTGDSLAMLLPPVLGGFLLVSIKLQGVIAVDFATFFCGIFTLLIVRFPNPKPLEDEDPDEKSPLLKRMAYGWKYIQDRPGLLGLMLLFAVTNFLLAIVGQLITPLILSFSSAGILGIVYGIDGAGMLLASLLMSTWRGPTQRIPSILGFHLLGGICLMATGLKESFPLIAVATFLFGFGSTIINISSQGIWQTKVAPSVQGRVFAVEGMIYGALQPFAYILVGPLADRIFEPAMAVNGVLAGSFGQILGVGTGRGIGLMFMVMGSLSILTTFISYQYPRIRFLEDELPDQI